MSEREGSDEGGPTGRRWRLTLALRPWVTERHGKQEEKVRSTLFAGSCRSGGATLVTDSELVAESVGGEAISSVGSSSNIWSEFKRVANDSRFWALADVNSSDEESSMEEVHPSSGEFCSELSRLVHSGQGHSMAEKAPVTVREAAPIASRPERRLKDRKQ
jgi:hypothetical protein